MTKHSNPVTWITDSLMNLVSGLGMSHDKNANNMFVLNELSQQDVEAAYRGDWVSRKVVDIPAYDMAREGRQWQAKAEIIESIENEEKRLGLWEKLTKVMKMARLYGGAALIIGGPGNMDEELSPRDVTRGSLRFIWAVSRYNLNVVKRDYDLYSPYFGNAEMWELHGIGTRRWKIHPSRLIIFKGNEKLGSSTGDDPWGDSVLQVVNDAIINAGVAQAGIAGLIHEAKIDIISIPNLMENLGSDDSSNALMKRFMYASMAKSSQNALILDSEEKWERKQINFTQLPNVLKLYMQLASAACDIPATRFVGLSPQGLNATGDTEERMYYDRIKGDQKAWLQPKLEGLDEMIMRSARGTNPRAVFYVWNPLWQMTAKEAAEVSKQKAETVKTIKETGLIPDEVLQKSQANQLIEDSQFPGFEDAWEASSEADRKKKLEEQKEETEQPEADPTQTAPNTQGPTAQGETE